MPDVPAGPRESDTACFLPWANASNTPFRLFKHWLHEGGSATPFIVHYPKLIREGRIESGYYAHVKDIMATALDLAGARYPSQVRGYPVLSTDSRSLVPNMTGVERENPGDPVPGARGQPGPCARAGGSWSPGTANRGGSPPARWEGVAARVRGSCTTWRPTAWSCTTVAAAHPQLRDRLIEEYGRFSERTGVADWERIQRDLERFYGE